MHHTDDGVLHKELRLSINHLTMGRKLTMPQTPIILMPSSLRCCSLCHNASSLLYLIPKISWFIMLPTLER